MAVAADTGGHQQHGAGTREAAGRRREATNNTKAGAERERERERERDQAVRYTHKKGDNQDQREGEREREKEKRRRRTKHTMAVAMGTTGIVRAAKMSAGRGMVFYSYCLCVYMYVDVYRCVGERVL